MLPYDVLAAFRSASSEVLEEASQESEIAGRIYKSYMDFYASARAYHDISERAYINVR